MDKTAKEIRLIRKYNFQNLDDVKNIKNKLTENINNLKVNKEKLLKNYAEAEGTDKENIQTKIAKAISEINMFLRNIQTY